MKNKVLTAVLAVALAVMAGINPVSASVAPDAQTFSVRVHIVYPSGFVYDGPVATGVAPADLNDRLAECGRSHQVAQWLKLHCYAVAE